MKKIIILLLILLNVTLFFNSLNIQREQDEVFASTLPRISEDVSQIFVILENMEQTIERERLINVVEEIASQYDVTIVNGTFYWEEQRFIYHFMGDVFIDEYLGLATEYSLNFIENRDYFYTNRQGVEQGVYFFLINREIELNIFPFSHLKTFHSANLIFSSANNEQAYAAARAFAGAFPTNAEFVGELSGIPFVPRDEMNRVLPLSVAILSFGILILLIMYVHQKTKVIAIYRTFGYSVLRIAYKLFGTIVLGGFLAILFSNVLLFTVTVGAINVRTFSFIAELFYGIGIQLSGFLGAILVSCVVINIFPLYSMIKERNVSRTLMYVNQVVKIAILVLTLPMMLHRTALLLEDGFILRQTFRSEFDDFQFIQRYQPDYLHMTHTLDEQLDIWMDFFMNQDREIIYRNQALYNYHYAFGVLNERGALLSESFTISEQESGLMVNENFLERFPLVDAYGTYIDFRQFDVELIYFVPEYYLNEGFQAFDFWGEERRDYFFIWDSYYNNHGNTNFAVVVIRNEQEIFDFIPHSFTREFLARPYMITLFRESSFHLNRNIFFNLFYEGDINEVLYGTAFYERVVISTMEDEMAWVIGRVIGGFLENLFLLAITLALVLAIIIQYVYLYTKVFQKRILIMRSMGIHPLRIHYRLLLESATAVVAAIMISLFLDLDIRFLLLILFFDFASYLMVSLWKRPMKMERLNND